jgi:hypothetical protein
LVTDQFGVIVVPMSAKHLRIPVTWCGLLILLSWPFEPISVNAEGFNPTTDWLKSAQYGVVTHVLPGSTHELTLINEFDVQKLADQLETVGARYLVLTLGQNSGFINPPNATYDRITGYAPGEPCSTRDLPLDPYRKLSPKSIKMMPCLSCQVPNRDPRAQEAFGLPQGAQDQPIDEAFANQWAQVISEWSACYQDKVAGWWFDGGYEWIGFRNDIARIYAEAVKRGNPEAIIRFNPGVSLISWTDVEDHTAGKLREPFEPVPSVLWLEGSQWHALIYLGTRWSTRETRYPAERWAQWVVRVVANEGAVSLDGGPNWDPAEGPVGSVSEIQLTQLKAIVRAVAVRARVETHLAPPWSTGVADLTRPSLGG